MAGLLLSAEERGIITFWLWNTLAYPVRLLVSFGCIAAGFGLQSVIALSHDYAGLLTTVLPGAALIFIGNLFLLVQGYDSGIVKEYKEEGDVEVFVIRQHTTRISGYHAKYKDVRRIFLEGLEVAEKSAVKT